MTINELMSGVLSSHDGYSVEIIEYCNEQELNDICAILDAANVAYSLHTDKRANVSDRHIASKTNITDFVNINYIKIGV